MTLTETSTSELDGLRTVLEEAKRLCESENIFVRVAGERIAVIAVDALYELDDSLIDPWEHLTVEVPGA